MNTYQVIQILFLVVIIIGLGGVITALNFFVGDKDNLQEVQKNLAIIAGTSSVLIMILGIILYINIRVDPQTYFPVILLLNVVSLEVALIAVSSSILQKTS